MNFFKQIPKRSWRARVIIPILGLGMIIAGPFIILYEYREEYFEVFHTILEDIKDTWR